MGTDLRADQEYLYDAFISYRHSELDMKAAIKLHRALEGFRIPGSTARQSGIKKIKKLFRDQEELPTSNNLGDDIQKALEQSRYLIVVCSPRTPQSKWCCQEIEEFRRLHGDNRILSILIEGEPDQAFPNSLRFIERKIQNPDGTETIEVREVEPLAADIRGKNKGEMWKKLRIEKLRLIAPMIGVRFDDLRHRQRERFIKRAAALALTVSAFFAAFGIVASVQSNIIAVQSRELAQKNGELQTQIAEKEKQRELADKNGKEAQKQAQIALENQKQAEENESKALAETSIQETDNGNRLAGIKLALEALPGNGDLSDRPFVPEAVTSLYHGFYNKPFQGRFVVKDHTGMIYDAAYSPDGRYVATVAGDLTIKIWDIASGNLKLNLDMQGYDQGASIGLGSKYVITNEYNDEGGYELNKNGNVIRDLETGKIVRRLDTFTESMEFCGFKFSADGKELVVTSPSGGAKVFDTETWTLLSSVGTPDSAYNDYLYEIDFTGGRIIAYSPSADAFNVYDINNGAAIFSDKVDGKVSCAAFSSDGTNFAVCSDTGSVYLFDCATLQNGRVLSGHKGKVKGAAFNVKYDTLLTYSEDNTARLWNYKKGTLLYAFDPSYGVVTSADLSPTDDLATTAYEDGRVVVWNCSTGKEAATLGNHENSISKVCFSPDGRTLTSVSYDNTARIWDICAGNGYVRLNGHTDSIICGDFSPDGKKVATASKDGSLRVWDPLSGKELYQISKPGTWFLSTRFSQDGKTLMAAEIDSKSNYYVNTYDASDGTGKDSQNYFIYPRITAYDFDMMHEHTEMLVFWEISSMLWDRADLSFLDQVGNYFIDASTGRNKLVAGGYSDDGKKFVSANSIPTDIYVWDVEARDIAAAIPTYDDKINSVEYAFFSPDASKVVTVTFGKGIYIWDANTGQKIMKIPDQSSMYTFATYSPDGKMLATGCIDGTICLWDCENYRRITTLKGYCDAINWLDFSPDGKSVLSVAYDGSAIVWKVFPEIGEITDYGEKLLQTY